MPSLSLCFCACFKASACFCCIGSKVCKRWCCLLCSFLDSSSWWASLKELKSFTPCSAFPKSSLSLVDLVKLSACLSLSFSDSINSLFSSRSFISAFALSRISWCSALSLSDSSEVPAGSCSHFSLCSAVHFISFAFSKDFLCSAFCSSIDFIFSEWALAILSKSSFISAGSIFAAL